MIFLAVLIVFLLVQWWGSGKPLHHDGWFWQWCDRVQAWQLLKAPGARLTATLAGPVVGLLLISWLLTGLWFWLGLLVAVPVLLYALGRGGFSAAVNEYLNALHEEDWDTAREVYAYWRHAELTPAPDVPEGNWDQLNQLMYDAIGYRGLERLFAVLFWFVLLGPAGALWYRLTQLYTTRGEDFHDSEHARRLLWLLEWPAARMLGLSFALTGNFSTCFHAWMECLWCRQRTSVAVMTHYLQGALGAEPDDLPAGAITHREFKAALSLFYRTWVFWMCLLAIVTLLW